MNIKKNLMYFFSAVAIGTTVYASHTTYGNYIKSSKSGLLLANIEALTDETEMWNPYCYNGGPGSNSCSIDAGISIAGYGVSGACSVSCNSGYYSCCGIRCTCEKDDSSK